MLLQATRRFVLKCAEYSDADCKTFEPGGDNKIKCFTQATPGVQSLFA